jgi:predicted  nucleic acid-binding Zn-ribbon protein
MRKQRPGIELCRDKAMMALYKEIYALKQAIDVLNAKLQELEATMSQLMRTKGALQHDIKMKEIALFVDRDKCLSLRQNFPISTFKETRYPKHLGSNGLPQSKMVR